MVSDGIQSQWKSEDCNGNRYFICQNLAEHSVALATNQMECRWKDYSSLHVLIPILILLCIGIAVGIYFLKRLGYCEIICAKICYFFREKKPVEVEVVVDNE